MHLSDRFLNLRDTAFQPEVSVEYREVTLHSTGLASILLPEEAAAYPPG